MSRTNIIDHQNKKIFFIDFSNLKSLDEIKTLIVEAQKHIHKQPSQSVLTLTNVENTHFNTEISDLFTDYIKSNKNYVKARAILGVSGLKLVLYNSFQKVTGSNMRAFPNIEEAKNWLAAQ